MKPLMVNLYWGGQILFKAGIGVCYDPPVTKCSTLIRDKLSYRELLDLVYNRVGITKEAFKVNMLFRYPTTVGSNLFFSTWKLHDEDTVNTFYEVAGQLESFLAELYIETEPVFNNKTLHSFESLLESFPNDLAEEVPRHGSTSDRPERVVNENFVSLNGDKVFTGDEINTLDGDKDGEDYDFEEDEEIDPPSSNKEMHCFSSASDSYNEGDPSTLNVQGMMSGTPHKSFYDYGGADDSDRTDRVWSEDSSEIQLGLWFEDKEQLKRAISLWSIKHSREYKVIRSNGDIWFADCKLEVEAVKGGKGLPGRRRCLWSVHAVRRKDTHKMWEITKWVKDHSCVGEDRSSTHKNWTSSMIANRIRHLIEDDPSFTVKSIRKFVKEEFGVNISYKKGWTAQQKAIELINSSKA